MKRKLENTVQEIGKTILVLDGLLVDLEDHDNALPSEYWGMIQTNLINLKADYEGAIDMIESYKLGEIQAVEREKLIKEISEVASKTVIEELKSKTLPELYTLSKVHVDMTFSNETVH